MRNIGRRLLLATVTAGLLAACNQAGAAGGGKMTAPEIAIGNPNAKVTVVEYASVTCSHCARFSQEVFPQFKKKYVDTGRVRYVFRELLTPPEQLAAAGFLIARCAGPSKYLSVVDSLFRTQATLFQTQDARAWLYNTAKSAGLNEAQVKACVEDEAALKALNDRVQTASDKEKISGTPTFLFNGKKVEGQTIAGQPYNGGELSLAQLDAVLQPLLAKK